jgi:hypothetical protein
MAHKQHVCTDACGITPDPGCPVWDHVRVGLSPEEVRDRKVALWLVGLVREQAELVRPLLVELLAAEFVGILERYLIAELPGALDELGVRRSKGRRRGKA